MSNNLLSVNRFFKYYKIWPRSPIMQFHVHIEICFQNKKSNFRSRIKQTWYFVLSVPATRDTFWAYYGFSIFANHFLKCPALSLSKMPVTCKSKSLLLFNINNGPKLSVIFELSLITAQKVQLYIKSITITYITLY